MAKKIFRLLQSVFIRTKPSDPWEGQNSLSEGLNDLKLIELENAKPSQFSELKMHAEPEDDNNSLQNCQNLWQCDDWNDLADLSITRIEKLNGRAAIAMLASASNAHLGRHMEARELLRAAIDWGVDKKAAGRFLAENAYRSLSKANTLAKIGVEVLTDLNNVSAASEADQHPDSGGAIFGDSRPRLMVDRQNNAVLRFNALHTFETMVSDQSHRKSRHGADKTFAQPFTVALVRRIVAALGAKDLAEKAAALSYFGMRVRNLTRESERLEYALTEIDVRGLSLKLVHVKNDYIPTKVATTHDFYEAEFLDFLRALHQEGGYIVDCGANIGNHSIYFSKVINAPTIAIEPEPHNASCLAINLALNDTGERVQLLNCALGSEAGVVKLAMHIGNNFGSFGKTKSDSDTEPLMVTVPVMKLDNVSTILGTGSFVSLIKIDVEGMELDVLQGAVQIIKDFLPVIAVECSTHQAFFEIEAELEKYDYYAVEVMNATPTFVFLSRNNKSHLNKIGKHLRGVVLSKAQSGGRFH